LGPVDLGSGPASIFFDVESALCGSRTAARAPIQLMTQWIKDGGSRGCLTFWDLGSQVTLVTTQYAWEQKLPKSGSSQLLTPQRSGSRTGAAGHGQVQGHPVEYEGLAVSLVAHGLENTASNLDAIDPRILRQAFPEVPEEGLEGGSGKVSLLVGQDNLTYFL
jgi:hypothetical protein